jgi:hypothetical protein
MMNEQIKELARKAGISILYEYDGYDGHAGVANFDDIEKFAGLIVQECAKFMDDNSGWDDNSGCDDSNNCWFPEPEDMLKHFGVKK